jgi:phosphoglucomutase
MTSPLAGKPPPPEMLVDVPALVAAYYTERPDPSVAAERVAFGTSGHRGSSLARSFTEWHILAVTQAICAHRARAGVTGPLFLGVDTHALSEPAFRSALEVLAANAVEVRVAGAAERWTPTPAVSHAILCHNRGRTTGLADGIVVTPSHNPPEDGGFKYNPPSGGPADADATAAIERHANDILAAGLRDVRRVPYARARAAGTTREHDFLGAYVADLPNVLDLAAIRDVRLRMGVDPLGGAGVRYWSAIAERHRLDLTVVNDVVDPTFRFMTVDWDGRIRMDPSSPFAMQRLLGLRDRFDVAFGCDTDHDRHGIVTRSAGLLPPNHFLAVSIDHLFRTRTGWRPDAAVGKTMVSSSLIDRVAARLGRRVDEVPVGFKWFVDGLLAGRLGFAGEESAGATFLRRDGTAWTTDKDAIVPALLAAEITAATGRDPGEAYAALAAELGAPAYTRVDAPASAAQKAVLKTLTAAHLALAELGGDRVAQALTHAPGNGGALGGIKVMTAHAWFAARPSGTEDVYKLYAESFRGEAHLRDVLADAQAAVARAFAAAGA